MAKGEFKKDEFDFQKEYFKAKSVNTIFDVGANIGYMSQRFRDCFPGAVVHAFEPFPGSYSVLENTARQLKNIIVNRWAVGSEKSKKTFFVNANVDTNSLLEPKKTGLSSDRQCKNVSSIEVTIDTIDNYCSENNILKIDILKLDIQGGELDALKGAAGMLIEGKIELIYTEAYFIEQYENQPRFDEISTLLFKYGYRLQDIYNIIYGDGCIAWCDLIFIK